MSFLFKKNTPVVHNMLRRTADSLLGSEIFEFCGLIVKIKYKLTKNDQSPNRGPITN